MRYWSPGQQLVVCPAQGSGHTRVPEFLQGKCGTVERYWGEFPNPEARSVGDLSAPPVSVYLLSFDPQALWPDSPRQNSKDRVLVDVYAHNLMEKI